jgi:hypothetical protein
VRWAAIESVKILPDTSRIGAIRERVAHRRGNRNIGAVARPPENSSSSSSTDCATTTSTPCTAHPAA